MLQVVEDAAVEEPHLDVDEACLKAVVWQDEEDEAVLLDVVEEEEEERQLWEWV